MLIFLVLLQRGAAAVEEAWAVSAAAAAGEAWAVSAAAAAAADKEGGGRQGGGVGGAAAVQFFKPKCGMAFSCSIVRCCCPFSCRNLSLSNYRAPCGIAPALGCGPATGCGDRVPAEQPSSKVTWTSVPNGKTPIAELRETIPIADQNNPRCAPQPPPSWPLVCAYKYTSCTHK